MAKYRAGEAEVEAVPYADLAAFGEALKLTVAYADDGREVARVDGPFGSCELRPGQWLVKTETGFEVVAAEVFEREYTAVVAAEHKGPEAKAEAKAANPEPHHRTPRR